MRSLTFMCVLLLAGCTAKQQSSAKPDYVYVIQGSQGEVTKAPNGNFELILNREGIQALTFTKAPFEIEKERSGQEVAAKWQDGELSFGKDQPNAAIVINKHVQAVILSKIEIKGDEMIFTLRPLGSKSIVEMKGPAQIFIDGNPFSSCCENEVTEWMCCG